MENIVPIKMYEYMAAAKPVIATRLPGLVREFGDAHGVEYVDNPHQVVPTALRLAEAGRISDLGKTARAFVSKNDWEAIADEFERLLQGVTNRTSVKDVRTSQARGS